MRVFRTRKKLNITITNLLVIVFLSIIFFSLLLFISYGKSSTPKIIDVANHKIEKVTYQFFSDLITEKIINESSTNDLIYINDSSKNEIVSIDYNMEKTYELLTHVSKILKESLSDFENGLIDVKIYDEYLNTSKSGLYLNLPFFVGTNNIFLSSLGPKIPVHIHFTGSLLTNIKTKVTNYGLNNALLEIYITILINEQLITPVTKENLKLNYDILIAAKVINGKVPSFYGTTLESNSNLVDTPIEN